MLAASLFHISALVLLPFYWLLRIRFPGWLLFGILGFSLVLSFIFPLKGLISMIPRYGQYLTLYSEANQTAALGLGYFSKLLIAFAVILFRKKLLGVEAVKYTVVMNGFIFYVALMTLFNDFMVFLRISYYFHIFIILLLPRLAMPFTYRSRPIVLGIASAYCLLLCFLSLKAPDAYMIPYRANLDLWTTATPLR